MRTFLLFTVVLACAPAAVGCSSSGQVSSSTDAAADVLAADAPVKDVATVDTYVALPPPSLDCRFVDDGTTCVQTYSLTDRELYECGHLAVDDDYDAGIAMPFPPPLGSSWSCLNGATPLLDAGVTEQEGALWCCGPSPNLCVRATGIDGICAGSPKPAAFSCPQMDAGFPSGSNDGKSCVVANVADAGLTPPLGPDEAIYCCPAP
jgi:hypothetical protein